MVDAIFTNGPIFTADAAGSWATSLAVSGDRIVAVGHDDVLDLRTASTEIVDLRGRLLTPGFVDSHVHPAWGGLDMLRCDLAGTDVSRDAYLATIAAYVAEHAHEPWLLGGGWAMAAFPGGTPLAADLDRIVPDRPAFLTNRDGHGAWANSVALRMAGITASTPDPADGRIERLADGSPSGTLHEGAMTLVNRLIPVESPERMREALVVAQRYLHSLGVVGWQDAILGDYGDAPNPGPTYLALASAGELTARVRGALWWERGRGVEQIPELVERREAWTAGTFTSTSVKIMQDGVAENFTAGMLEPYCDGHGHATTNDGLSFHDPAVLAEALPELELLGFQAHFHAIGDRAVRECLDAVAAARAANGWVDSRPHISHIQVVHPADRPRFRQLGVAANMQMLWAVFEDQMLDLTIPFLGGEDAARVGWQYPFASLAAAGATLAAGSDWSVSTPDPWAAIHVGVNRTEPGTVGARPFLPSEALPLPTALSAYTAGSAWLNRWESGVLAPGRLADLAIASRDPFAGASDEIGDTANDETWVGGRRVYVRE
ncbi:amidohydrolase [Agrococcus jejuensis]|uniref:amidohydrolase n=1 Tax=Agrococcus jejuensis TaxID=399736 RepID=UPI0011A4072C|nr:amidohydrolase [Agrococcus jejuensis]